MKTLIVLSAGIVPFVLGLAVMANEKPTPELQAAMKSNGSTQGAMRMHIMAKDYDAVAADAATLKANYTKTDAFWAAKKWDDAIALNKKGATAAADIETAARAKNDEQLATASMTLATTCAGCHKTHREQLPDKTYEVK